MAKRTALAPCRAARARRLSRQLGQGTRDRHAEGYTQKGRSEMNARRYPVIIEQTGTGFSAYSPDVPGCVAAGDTQEETRRNFQDALAEHFVPAKLKDEVKPLHHVGIGEFAFPAQDLGCSFNRAIVRSLGEGREEPDRPHVNDFAWMSEWRDSVLMEHGSNRF